MIGKGERLGGVIVVLSTRRDAFREPHLQALGAYGAFVRMAIATQLRTAEASELPSTPSVSVVG